jgi:hypothetical protein
MRIVVGGGGAKRAQRRGRRRGEGLKREGMGGKAGGGTLVSFRWSKSSLFFFASLNCSVSFCILTSSLSSEDIRTTS